uniref:DUF6454 family protein n=1 Tax=Bosea sp. (in: a-proteobacteria) TaxID=1871050 RepID=UPI002FC5EA02
MRTTLMALAAAALATTAQAADPALNTLIPKLTRATQWTQKAAVELQFPTHHPQGMVKIGDAFFISSVEIKKPTTRYPALQDGYDRDTGE